MNKERTMQTGGVGKRIAKEYKTAFAGKEKTDWI